MPAPSPLLVLLARAEARAILLAAGEYESKAQALAPLINDAAALAERFGAETVFDIIRTAFEADHE
jgi:hypothetical protein